MTIEKDSIKKNNINKNTNKLRKICVIKHSLKKIIIVEMVC